MLLLASAATLVLAVSGRAVGPDVELSLGFRSTVVHDHAAINMTAPGAPNVLLDQTKAPGNLTLLGNSTLFKTFRPKARFIAPEGWMNDPMAMYERSDGSFHVGYQCHPQHIQWGNISMCAATSKDFATWEDLGTVDDRRTLFPSMIYDIRGVFDGTILPRGTGFNNHTTILYTSTHTGPLGATEMEKEGTETQSIAYTKDGGASWTKLRFGAGGNPVIYEWPLANLTGFRDPYAFTSPKLAMVLANATSHAHAAHTAMKSNTTTSNASKSAHAESDLFVTVSGGVHDVGAKLLLYRQSSVGDIVNYDYIGPLFETPINSSWSEFSGNNGINFETASVIRLNENGDSLDDGTSTTAVDFLAFGTERGRLTHERHWPLWAAVDYSLVNGSVKSTILYAGVIDWGRAYAYLSFPASSNRSISVGWTYEDDEDLVLAKQQGYQGALTTFRENFVKVTKRVNPATNKAIFNKGSWGVKNATDGSVTVSTLGQRVVPSVLAAYKAGSIVSAPANAALIASAYVPFKTQPTGRHYVVTGSFEFQLNSTASVGFRVLSSDTEYTDVLYDPVREELTINRDFSSLIKSYGNDTELARLKLWNVVGTTTRTLNLTIIVDNSAIEVHANEEAVISTRAYPWLSNSTGAGLLSVAGAGAAVQVSKLQLWSGLIEAFPNRPERKLDLFWDGPIAAIFGLWAGF